MRFASDATACRGSGSPASGIAPGHEALQALLAFSSLHEQIRQRRARERLGAQPGTADVWELEQFVLDEVLQLVSERALTLTGADGIAIALAEGNAFVCRASAGTIAPEPGARLDPKSGFSGACLRTGGIVRCDDSENDPRVNVQVCRRLGTRSIVAVPIASSRGTIGLLEAFSAEAYGFNDSDVRSLNLLAELILAAMKPEEENRLAEISQRLVAGDSADSSDSTDLKKDAAEALPSQSSNGEGNATGVSAEKDIVGVPEFAESFVEASKLADPPAETPIFEAYQKTQKSKSRVGLVVMLLLLLAVAAAAAGMWWKKNRLKPAESPPTAVAAPVQVPEQTQAAPAAPTSEVHPSSSIQPMRQLVTGIWHVSSPDSSTVIIDLQGEVQYEAHRLADPDRIYFDLHGTALAQGLFGKTIEVGDSLLARVRVAQPRKGISRVVLETNGPSDFSVSVQSNPYRLVVEIRKAAQYGRRMRLSTLVRRSQQQSGSVNDLQNAGLPEYRLTKSRPRREARVRRTTTGPRAQVSPGARCRTRRLGPGNRGTQRSDGKRSGARHCGAPRETAAEPPGRGSYLHPPGRYLPSSGKANRDCQPRAGGYVRLRARQLQQRFLSTRRGDLLHQHLFIGEGPHR